MDINGQDECVQSNPSGRARPPLTLSVLGGTVSPRLQDSNLTVAGGNVTYAFTSHFHSHYSPSRTRSNPNSSERRRESQRPLTARLGTSMRRLFTSRNNSHPERNTVSRDDGIEAPVIDIGATGDSDEGIGSSISSSGGASEREGFSVISLHEDNADELVPPSLRRVQRAGPTVYARQMINELGFPLWMPKPSSLPDNRVEQGITPGDVGVFTDDGGFCYLFNIWSDKDALRDIDVPGLREFVPPPERMVQVSNDIIREMGTLSEGAEVKRIYPQGLPRRYCDFRFEWSKAEGAVMVVPFGALSESLTDRTALEPFIKHNCQRLYQLARTKGIFKASLYLVTGTVKSGSWAIAAHCAQTAPTPPFPSAELHNETRGSESLDGYAYQWAAHSSGTKAHTGPEYLASGSDSKNQCLFIRGYRLTMCSDGAPSSGQSSSDVASTPSASPVASHVPNVPSISGSSLSASESRQADTAPHPPEGHNLQRSYMLKLYPVTSPDNYPPDYLNHLIRSFAKNNLSAPNRDPALSNVLYAPRRPVAEELERLRSQSRSI
ncbi:hypothetical protein FA15DRAFT_373316 [Coprinopsis marcescibilis]|uniref:Uncharacterized protein n=1 Tax=Coprinopsis marcescibilis TaxID=230819 RepID=A0A5C3KXD4_COPMA|nr:hypothetical protein FA15DRAFT_373316 [Coprinopsis marcescibilis]